MDLAKCLDALPARHLAKEQTAGARGRKASAANTGGQTIPTSSRAIKPSQLRTRSSSGARPATRRGARWVAGVSERLGDHRRGSRVFCTGADCATASRAAPATTTTWQGAPQIWRKMAAPPDVMPLASNRAGLACSLASHEEAHRNRRRRAGHPGRLRRRDSRARDTPSAPTGDRAHGDRGPFARVCRTGDHRHLAGRRAGRWL